MEQEQKRHISLKDLARELGVSISTVSRALNDHPNISPGVKKKVRSLARKRDYSPNPLAMGLLKQNTRIIGVIVPDLITHFFSSVISGIESYAREKDYYIIISSSNESLEKEKESIENLLNSRVEGIIACLSAESDDTGHFETLIGKGIPLVFFDRIALEGEVSSVVADNSQAAHRITTHFAEAGYQRIALISGPPHMFISRERERGYLDGLKKANMRFRKKYLVHSELDPASATTAMRQLLALPEPPDAVFGINDTVAFAAMKEIRRQALRIPEDIGIVGFSNEYHATVVEPELSSVSHPSFEMGRKAAELFFEALDGKPPRQILMETSLMVRDSSGGPQE